MRKNKNNKEIIWVEHLGFIGFILLLFKTIHPGCPVLYNEHRTSSLVKKTLGLFKKIKVFSNFHNVSLSYKKDSKEYSLYYQMKDNLYSCCKELCERLIPDKPEWFKKMVMTYAASLIIQSFSFAALVKSRIDSKKKHIAYLTGHPLNFLISGFYQDNGFTIKQFPNPLSSIAFFIRPAYLIFTILAGKLLPKKVKTNISQIKPSIWVEYAHNDVIDFTFWRQAVKAKDFDIVYYLDRSDSPCNAEIINKIEKLGLKWINANIISLAKLSRFALSDFRELFSGLLSYFFLSSPIWFKIFLFEKDIKYFLYRSVFRYAQVKVLIQHQETSWLPQVQKMAVESAGGIMVGFHWSIYLLWKDVPRINTQHVYFVWGKMFYSWAQKRQDTCNYVLPSGLYLLPDDNAPEKCDFFSEKVNFILAIFDSAPSAESYDKEYTPEHVSQFYLTVLNLIEGNCEWGGIIKSKMLDRHDFELLPKGDEITRKMDKLLKDNRLIVLSPHSFALTAADNAMLSVCCKINSVGILAAINGYRAIHWDCSGMLRHPLYMEREQKFIFPTLDELEQAIIKASNGDNAIGDFSKWRQRLNYFDDFKAPQRVGKFIQTFMDEIIKTDNMRHSLDFSVKGYIEENKIGEEFFKPESWWDE